MGETVQVFLAAGTFDKFDLLRQVKLATLAAMNISDNPLAKRLVEHFGGRAEAARAMSRSTETIRLWLKNGIPVAQAIEVEQKSGGLLTAEAILEDAKRIVAASEIHQAAA